MQYYVNGAVRKILIVIAIIVTFHQRGLSQLRYEVHRVEGISARATVLGGGNVADAYDATVLLRNPGALAMLPGASFLGGYSADWDNMDMGRNTVFAVPLGQTGSIAAAFSKSRVDYVKSDTAVSFPVRNTQYTFDLGYGYRITRSVGVGARVGFRYVESLPYRLWELTPAVGFFYNPSPEVSYGITYYDYGSPLEVVHDIDSLGHSFGGWRSNDPQRSLQVGLNLSLRIWRRDPVITMALVNEKIFKTPGLSYKGGFEFRPLRFIALRAGYFVKPNATYGIYGAGLSIRWFDIDWVVSPSQLSDRFQQVTFVVRLYE